MSLRFKRRATPALWKFACWTKNACTAVGIVYLMQLFLYHNADTNIDQNANTHSRNPIGELAWQPELRIQQQALTVAPLPVVEQFDSSINEKAQKTSPKNVTKVIVLAYYRGGSTFLAQLLNHNPQVYYLFEPLADEFTRYKLKMRMNAADIYVNPKTGKLRPLKNGMREFVIDASLHLLNCDYDQLPDTTFHHAFVLEPSFIVGKHFNSYRKCMKYDRPDNLTKIEFRAQRSAHYKERHPHCKSALTSECNKRNTRAFKTIRMTLSQAYKVLKKDPDVKIIYSTRDPRATVSSRYKIDETYRHVGGLPSFPQRVKELCVRVRHDLEYLPKMIQDFPDNIFVTSFEVMVKNSTALAQEYLDFLGLQMHPEVKRWLQKQKKVHNSGPHGNVTEKWRKDLTAEQIDIVQSECTDLIEAIGSN